MNQFEVIEKETDRKEYLKFERVENKRSGRPDLHAFMLLDFLFGGDREIIRSSGHDEFYLDVSLEQINEISYKHAIELVRCGVMFDKCGLCMFT